MMHKQKYKERKVRFSGGVNVNLKKKNTKTKLDMLNDEWELLRKMSRKNR